MAKRRHLSRKQIAAGFGGKKRKSHKRRASSSSGGARKIRTRRNPTNGEGTFKRHRRRISENFIGSWVGSTLLPAGAGALGALALDYALPHIPLPATFQTPTLQPVVKIGGAIALGFLAQMVVSKRFGGQLMAGALTTTLYGMAKDKLGEMSTPPATTTAALQAYANGRRRLGYYSPARSAGLGVYTSDDLAYG